MGQARHNDPDTEQLVLAGLFPAADRAAWLALVEQGRRGAPFERLVSHTYDNLAIQPLYTRADWQPETEPVGVPGMMPFTRGALPAGHVAGGWDVRQAHAHPDLEASHAAILTDLARGVTSLQWCCEAAGRLGLDPDDPAAAALAGVDGLMLYAVHDLETLLRQVRLNDRPLALEPGAQFVPLAALLMALWQRQGVAAATARGAFNADPLGVLALSGELPASVSTMLQQMVDLATFTVRHYPQVTSIRVDTSPYHGAGATEVQELACSLATAVTYVRALTQAGMAIDTACQQITFAYAVDPDVFLAIAKLRTARRLWARVAEACGASVTARRMQLHVQTARRVMSQRDPWVINILRATVACFAAAVAGADSITVLPYDAALGLPGDVARRIARNTQLILQEESGVHRVIDPAGGSWDVERLSAELAQAAWTQFQAIEQAGGMAQALQQGMIAEMIAPVWAKRLQNLARRKDVVTGVSEFPDLDEQPVATVSADVGTLRRLAAECIGQWRAQHASTVALQQLVIQGVQYIRAGLAAGLPMDAFAPRLSFFWAIGMHFFMEVAKMRAARLLWARLVQQFAPQDARSLGLRTHCQTSGWSLTARDVYNNVVRTCVEAMAATHGHTHSFIRAISGIYRKEVDAQNASVRRAQELVETFAAHEGRRPRILIAKLGQDGHVRGQKVIATAFADLGFDVDIGPLFQTPEEAARQAVENDVHIIGASSLAAGHLTLVPALRDELARLGRDDILIVVGGVIPPQDYDALYAAGARAIFPPGTVISEAAIDLLQTLNKTLGYTSEIP